MHNFGKLTARPMEIETPSGPVTVWAFFDTNDVEWHSLFQQHPHDWYLAVTDTNHVVSMESDPEQSQIDNFVIMGITDEERNGFTRGPGGTVYGKVWDGVQIVAPPPPPYSVPVATLWGRMSDQEAEDFDAAVTTASPLRLRKAFNVAIELTSDTELFSFIRGVLGSVVSESRVAELLAQS